MFVPEAQPEAPTSPARPEAPTRATNPPPKKVAPRWSTRVAMTTFSKKAGATFKPKWSVAGGRPTATTKAPTTSVPKGKRTRPHVDAKADAQKKTKLPACLQQPRRKRPPLPACLQLPPPAPSDVDKMLAALEQRASALAPPVRAGLQGVTMASLFGDSDSDDDESR